MKTTISIRRRAEQASALTLTLLFALAAGTALGTYLVLTNFDTRTVARSQDWNCALAYAEAGVDEALAQINSGSSFSGNSWGGSGGHYGPVTRHLQNGYYTVSIEGDTAPTIYSTGFVYIAKSSQVVSRRIMISSETFGQFPVAFAAIGDVTLNGNGITTDSYNSHDPNLSNGGLYDSTKTSTNGDMATVQGVFNPGNHTVLGDVYLGPTATFAGGGTISGVIYSNYNVQFPDVVVPTPTNGYWTAAVPNLTTNTVVTYKPNGTVKSTTTTVTSSYHLKTSGDYLITGNYPIEIDAGVTVRLNVTASSLNLSGLQIHDGGNINNSGTAYIYVNGPTSISMAGNSAPDASNRPENLWIYGTSSLTSVSFSGNSAFVGVIYAPEVQLKLNGGGSNDYDFLGACVVGSITTDGHFHLHYDEYLSGLSSRGFIPTGWQEL